MDKHSLLSNLEHHSAPQLRRLLTELLTRQKLGLYWESDALERDNALNADIVLPRLVETKTDAFGIFHLPSLLFFLATLPPPCRT